MDRYARHRAIEGFSQEELQAQVREHVNDPVLASTGLDIPSDLTYYINPAGPFVTTTIRSDSSTASPTSWVIIITVLPSVAWICMTESCKWARVSASSRRAALPLFVMCFFIFFQLFTSNFQDLLTTMPSIFSQIICIIFTLKSF